METVLHCKPGEGREQFTSAAVSVGGEEAVLIKTSYSQQGWQGHHMWDVGYTFDTIISKLV